MAASLMTQWLFNFVIAKLTPILLADTAYGTFFLFGALCVAMAVYAVCCVPETRGVPLESIDALFEGDIIAGCLRDTVPGRTRANELLRRWADEDKEDGKKGVDDGQVEDRVERAV